MRFYCTFSHNQLGIAFGIYAPFATCKLAGCLWFWVRMLIQTWLFTGLFITAHDSMPGAHFSKTKAQ